MAVLLKGVRVVRGPDWSWGEQDGGEGHVGTVTSIEGGSGSPQWAVVQWDGADRRFKYRCGAEGKYDLRLFDSGPAGVKHPGSVCSSCLVENITGTLWRCVNCINYCLCGGCYSGGKHCLRHTFIRVDIGGNKQSGVHVPVRLNAEVVTAQGIFTGAEVVRGYNWKWGDQDGQPGNCGTVIGTKKWKDESFRSVVTVQWSHNTKKNIYRVGHRARVDVRCVKSASGGSYYPQHLLPLGAPCHSELTDQIFKAGDIVTTQLDYEVFKMMQEGHGGWNEKMALAIGRMGQVVCIDSAGDIYVHLSDIGRFWFNPASMIKTQLHQFSAGDRVKVITDKTKAMELQEDHGGWSDAMIMSLGQIGKVVRVHSYDCVDAFVAGIFWTFNVLCLTPVNDSEFDWFWNSLQLSLAVSPPSLAVPLASLIGDTARLKSMLEEHPNEINAGLYGGASALHYAVVENNIAVLKLLLQYKPNLELETEFGEKPLHLAAFSDHADITRLLLEAGADVNSRNSYGFTPAMIAVRTGKHRVLKALLGHPNMDINLQDSQGDTAFFAAVVNLSAECMAILLEAGADPTVLNHSCISALTHAAHCGLYICLEYISIYCPQHLNFRDDEGLTALHCTANIGFFNIVLLLLNTGVCDVNTTGKLGSTPLHEASINGNVGVVEVLITHGAHVNAQDSKGSTPLLIVLQSKKIDKPSDECPLTLKIYEDLIATYGSDRVEPYIASACLLMQYGADIHIKNKLGMSPLTVASPDVINILMSHQPVSPVATPLPEGATDLKPGTETAQTSDHCQVAKTTDSESKDADASEVLCFLCDSLANIRFEPCGDVVMCLTCAETATTKKCPKCMCTVQSQTKILTVADHGH